MVCKNSYSVEILYDSDWILNWLHFLTETLNFYEIQRSHQA